MCAALFAMCAAQAAWVVMINQWFINSFWGKVFCYVAAVEGSKKRQANGTWFIILHHTRIDIHSAQPNVVSTSPMKTWQRRAFTMGLSKQPCSTRNSTATFDGVEAIAQQSHETDKSQIDDTEQNMNTRQDK